MSADEAVAGTFDGVIDLGVGLSCSLPTLTEGDAGVRVPNWRRGVGIPVPVRLSFPDGRRALERVWVGVFEIAPKSERSGCRGRRRVAGGP